MDIPPTDTLKAATDLAILATLPYHGDPFGDSPLYKVEV